MLRGCDVDLQAGGKHARIVTQADEVIARVRGLKTDQLNDGHVRRHYRSGESNDVCSVAALETFRRHFPNRSDQQ